MPSRRRGWSSTESTRITLLTCLLPKQTKQRTVCRRTVSNSARDGQFNFSTRSRSAPNVQLASDLPCAFPHSRQTVVARTTLFQDLGWNALPIVATAQLEYPFP